ncbi:metal-dependent hydrolase [Actinomadura sp. DC4]|uniref:metal-dependent hydrolase n=1 Tax=Actinomadura sp. DC4 TaxID=3055069 RepID=UPI0025B1E687|nr:metal-dependent hydrolase [Actinomadura sp. DC4]MDN3358599.1 metal-dependent hydrolase [Actinomadura sp. DC4]
MTDLQIRKIDFGFDETIPFQWLPSHPKFGLIANAISIMAIGFEKFIVINTRAAIPLIEDPAVVDEAEAFLRQEAQHAKNHRKHVAALIGRYPGLKETLDEAIGAFDHLVETRSLEFRLAYTADLESTFTPVFKVMLDHEDVLFRPGDERVASLFLWHFVEEVEHRSSALVVCDAVVKNRYYRTRVARTVFRHIMRVYRNILAGFEKHVPEADRRARYRDVSPDGVRREEVLARLPLRSSWRTRLGMFPPSPFAPASNREMLVMAYRLMLSQTPHHRPEREPLPRFADGWFARYDAGYDVTRFYTGLPVPR